MVITSFSLIVIAILFVYNKFLKSNANCTTEIIEQIRRYYVETSKEFDRQRMDLGFMKELLTEIIEDHKKSVTPPIVHKKSPRKGRRMSEEHKQKIREAHMRRREENAIADWREESNKKAAEIPQPPKE